MILKRRGVIVQEHEVHEESKPELREAGVRCLPLRDRDRDLPHEHHVGDESPYFK